MGTDGSDSQTWYVRTFIALTLFVGTALAAPVSDSAALTMTRPKEQTVAKDITPVRLAALLKPVDAFYGFWVNRSPVLLARAIGSDFVDHTLPPGRPQGPSGPAQASKGFLTAVPDLKVAVVQRLVVDDRVISHLRFTGHFTGTFLWGTHAPANRWISSQPTSCACAMGGSRTTGIWKTISHSSNKSAWWRAANGMLEVPVM